MENCMITFRSVTPAQRGELLLRRSGIGCVIHRTPHALAEQGCGYCLRLWEKDITSAVTLLRHKQVALRKIYAQRSDGVFEELTV